MAALKWDQEGQKIIEAGVDHGVLYVYNPDSENLDSKYCPGEAWNGLTSYPNLHPVQIRTNSTQIIQSMQT